MQDEELTTEAKFQLLQIQRELTRMKRQFDGMIERAQDRRPTTRQAKATKRYETKAFFADTGYDSQRDQECNEFHERCERLLESRRAH